MVVEKVYHRGLRSDQKKPNSFDALVSVQPGDTIELDVVLLKDGTLGIVHPRDVGRTIEDVENFDAKGFQQLSQPFGSTKEEKMPLLNEVLFQLHDRGAKLFLELKASDQKKIIEVAQAVATELAKLKTNGAFSDEKFLESNLILHSYSVEGVEAMVKELRKYGLNIPVFLQWNKSPEFAKQMKISATGIDHAKTVTETPDWTEQGMVIAKKSGCQGIALHISALIEQPACIDRAHAHGLQIVGGGPIDDSIRKRLMAAGLDMYVE